MNKRQDDLNDDLSDLLGLGPRKAQADVKLPPASYQAPTAIHTERCRACAGSGIFRGYSGRAVGQCRACNGKGQLEFKTSGAQRAKAKVQRTERKARKGVEALNAFKAEQPAIYDWLVTAGRPGFDFPASMLEAITKYGYLTEKQQAACERLSAKANEDKAATQARIEAAPVADTAGIDRLKAAFDKAAAYTAAKAKGLTVRNPRITIGGLTISPAKANSKNPGALYVKGADRSYLGKIQHGKFIASRDCTPEQQTQVLAFVADPAEAAKVYGQETGVCCVCNAELRSEWRLKGIGPVCATKFGW